MSMKRISCFGNSYVTRFLAKYQIEPTIELQILQFYGRHYEQCEICTSRACKKPPETGGFGMWTLRDLNL